MLPFVQYELGKGVHAIVSAFRAIFQSMHIILSHTIHMRVVLYPATTLLAGLAKSACEMAEGCPHVTQVHLPSDKSFLNPRTWACSECGFTDSVWVS